MILSGRNKNMDFYVISNDCPIYDQIVEYYTVDKAAYVLEY